MYHHTRRIYSKLIHNPTVLNSILKRNAGHSKWANIKHIKGLKDGQKSMMFTKLSRQMKVAVQLGGSPDPKFNLKLEQVVEQAKRMSMPIATIESILKSTQTDKKQCKSYLIEIKGPGSCIILCDVFTENLHALKQVMATMLKKHSSKFSEGSGGMHFFDEKGIIIVDPLEGNKPEEDVLEIATEHAIESGAEDVQVLEDGYIEFICSTGVFNKVQEALAKLNYKINSASIEFIPNKVQTLSDTDLEICSNLVSKLENHPEIVRVFNNVA